MLAMIGLSREKVYIANMVKCRPPENRDPLRQNGTVIYLKRPIEKLAVNGRPLSAQNGVEALFQKRRPLYEAWAEHTVLCEDNAEKTVQNLLTALNAEKE